MILSVLKNIAKLSVDKLPKATFSRMMFLEARRLSQIHVAETVLTDYENRENTLHTDGTSKFGKHYGTYDIVTNNGEVL